MTQRTVQAGLFLICNKQAYELQVQNILILIPVFQKPKTEYSTGKKTESRQIRPAGPVLAITAAKQVMEYCLMQQRQL